MSAPSSRARTPEQWRARLQDGSVQAEDGCRVWTGTRYPNGYGLVTVQGRRTLVHRLSYELSVGPIPSGLVIDHLCRSHACIEPTHLDAVPQRINVLRGQGHPAVNACKTHCPQGHPYDAANTRISREGKRICRACHRNHQTTYLMRKASK